MIKVHDISKSFGEKKVLDSVSVDFEKGKTNLIIGKSGSGKTVLLKSIIGLHAIDEGQILFDGRDFTHMNFRERKELRKEFGMLFQGAALFDSFTVEENVRYPLEMFTNLSQDEKTKRADFCLARVDMEGSNQMFPSELSGGMRKRVGIARAIALNPRYLFCDEPNSGLDPQTAILIDKLIADITKENDMTTIVNTHDMNSVMEVGDKVVFIYEGLKCWEGSKLDIFNSENRYLNEFVFANNLAQTVRRYQNHKPESGN